jgi:outer membrane protein assembly factor BamB
MDSSLDAPETSSADEAACAPGSPHAGSGDVQRELDATPSLKWVKKVSDNVVVEGARSLVMSTDAVAVTTGNGLAILNKSSTAVKTFARSGSEMFHDVIVAGDGTFLLAGRSVYAVDREGALVWNVPLSSAAAIGSEWLTCRMHYSHKKQMLLAVCNDGGMYGVNVAARSVMWQAAVYSAGVFDIYPAPSVGEEALFAPAFREPRGLWIVDPLTGNRSGFVDTQRADIFALSSRGFLAGSAKDPLALLDNCGRVRWSVSAVEPIRIPLIIGLPDERVFVSEIIEGQSRLSVVALEDGKRLGGPVGSGTPIAAGADGTFYAVTCDNGNAFPEETAVAPDLVAYTGTLEEKWRVPLVVPTHRGFYGCPRAAVALAADGVMYMAVETDATYIVAVQTRSPGIASTPWPLRFRAHSGSRWLD